jgi:hypothetical protein
MCVLPAKSVGDALPSLTFASCCLCFCAQHLLQLMCVLPAKSVGDALPAVLANLIVLAENMEEDDSSSSTARKARLARQQQQQQQQRGSKAARKAARKQRQAAAAEKLQGLSGLDVLAALGEEGESKLLLVTSEDEEEGASSAAAEGLVVAGVDDVVVVVVDDVVVTQSQPYAGQEDAWGTWGTRHSAAAASHKTAAAAEYVALLGFEMSGDADVDRLRLAEQLAATFPSNLMSLVDLTGEPLVEAAMSWVEGCYT